MKITPVLFFVVIFQSGQAFGSRFLVENPDFYQKANIVEYVDGHPVTAEGQIVLERNEAGEMVTLPLDDYLATKGQNFLNLVANYFDFKKTFQTVTSYITETMEDRFDLFIVVNVDYRNLPYDAGKIPSQHMRIVRKSRRGQKVFQRNSDGEIVGFNSEALGASQGSGAAYDCLEGNARGLMEPSGLMKISSGKGRTHSSTPWWNMDAYLDTPTGVYRFNDSRNTLGYRGKNEQGQRVMWTPLYFDLTYRIPRRGTNEDGTPREPLEKESALAIHGTSTRDYKHLGRQASHGCIRTHRQVSQCVKKQFHSISDNIHRDSGNGGPLIEASLSDHTPFLEHRLRLKSELYNDRGQLLVKRGTPALFIIFYGYDEDLETGEIIEI